MDATIPKHASRVEFESFILDLKNRELRKDGGITVLKPQAFRVLTLLLESAGEFVTREEICAKVWPEQRGDGTPNRNLNEAIRQLRRALGDSQGRYIETRANLGYRIPFDATWIDSHIPEALSDSVPENVTSPTAGEKSYLGFKFWSILLAAAVAVVLLGTMYFLHRRRVHNPGSAVEIMLTGFENKTGDAAFDETLKLGLAADLEQSPFIHLTSEETIQKTLGLMERKPGEALTDDANREVCQRSRATVMVSGLIARLGPKYVVGLKAVDCVTGERLADEQNAADSEGGVISALSTAATSLRKTLGESAESLKTYDVPLANATTPSLAALQDYSLAMRSLDEDNYPQAIKSGKRAIQSDPNFAMAYLLVGAAYSSTNEHEYCKSNYRSAYQLRNRVTKYERLMIEASYDTDVVGNLDSTRRDLEELQRTYPADSSSFVQLGNIDLQLGRYDEALDLYKKAVSLSPKSTVVAANLGFAYVFANRISDAEALARTAEANDPKAPVYHEVGYFAAVVKQDRSAMDHEMAQLLGKPVWDDGVLDIESDGAANLGQFKKARELTQAAAASARRAGESETAASYEAESAVRDAVIGEFSTATREAELALSHSNGAGVEGMAGLALALAGKSSRAVQLEADLTKRFPEDTLVQFDYLPLIRAGGVLRSDPASAINALAPALPYELGALENGADFDLYAPYLRGQAYLALHQGGAAALEFQKIPSNPGVVLNEPILSLSFLQLARAEKMAGKIPQARDAYKNFLIMWKDADPDVSTYRDAKAEYSALSSINFNDNANGVSSEWTSDFAAHARTAGSDRYRVPLVSNQSTRRSAIAAPWFSEKSA